MNFQVIQVNNRDVTEPREVANILNNCFINLPLQLKAQIQPTALHHPLANQFSSPCVANSLFLTPVDSEEVEKCILKLSNKKSTGDDGISSECLKKVSGKISPYLAHIANLTFSTGKFPDALKEAIVVPLYKKGDRHSATSYRPISLLKVPGKILEKLMVTRLTIVS